MCRPCAVWIVILACLSCLPAVPSATADGPTPQETAAWLPTHTWTLGTEAARIHYEEPHFMHQQGYLLGVKSAYTYHRRIMLEGDLRIAFGRVDYYSPTSGRLDGIADTLFEARAISGYDLAFGDVVVTPFAGFGYRYLEDDMTGLRTTLGAIGYRRESNYYYSPLGVALQTCIDTSSFLTFRAEYDHFWRGVQLSRLRDVDPANDNLRNSQKSGYGLRAGVDWRLQNGPLDCLVGGFVRYWSIDASEVETVYYNGGPTPLFEPPNNSTEIGLTLSIIY